MALRDCTSFFGRRLVIPTLPSVRDARDVVFIPPVDGTDTGGLFEPSGRAVAEAILYSGIGGPHQSHGAISTPIIPEAAMMPDDFEYIFMGRADWHYGHFLIGAFTRLWALPSFHRSRIRVVVGYSQPLETLFALEHVSTLMQSVGLTRANFLHVTTPTRFRRIKVPAMAFEELSMVHTIFADMMHDIGSRFGQSQHCSTRRMIYLSKEQLKEGNVTVENEAEVTHYLRQKGVDVIFPEQLTMREQILLWVDDPVVMGFSGSALHTSIFFPSRTVIVMGHSSQMWVNQVLIDMVNKNSARYLFDDRGLEPIGAGGGFMMKFRIADTKAFADELYTKAIAMVDHRQHIAA